MNTRHGIINMPAVYSMSCVRKNRQTQMRKYVLTTFMYSKEEHCQLLSHDVVYQHCELSKCTVTFSVEVWS
jgi:hypothetical protein